MAKRRVSAEREVGVKVGALLDKLHGCSGVESLVYVALLARTDKSQRCVAPLTMLSERIGLHRNTTYRAVWRLSGRGLVEIEKRNRVASSYRLPDAAELLIEGKLMDGEGEEVENGRLEGDRGGQAEGERAAAG
jgi:predicted transcriptional regulator